MIYGRAYIVSNSVVALHTSDEPINIVIIEHCDLYDLTLSNQTSYEQISLVGGVVVGETVLTCTPVT
jgi:hypothetical protein